LTIFETFLIVSAFLRICSTELAAVPADESSGVVERRLKAPIRGAQLAPIVVIVSGIAAVYEMCRSPPGWWQTSRA
jgi:hypothetical protein